MVSIQIHEDCAGVIRLLRLNLNFIHLNINVKTMNEVSIIINGVRYDLTDNSKDKFECESCDLGSYCDCHNLWHYCNCVSCEGQVFKKSDTKFEI